MKILTLAGLLCGLCGAVVAAEIREPDPVMMKAPVVRIKDLADVQGVRGNQLVGNGIVIGLDSTGDSTSNTMATQGLANLIQRFGLKIDPSTIKAKNIASVLITATLPPFAKKGAHLDVQVSSVGDASSLQGGILLQTPLIGADGKVYAVSQGALSVGGFSAGGGGAGGASVQKNHPVVGRIPDGATVEREVPTSFAAGGVIRLRLKNPDFTTAQRLTECVNARWPNSASAPDLGEVGVIVPPEALQKGLVGFVADLECLTLSPDVRARIVINERTGTIVAGSEVRIAPAAISHGNLFITVKNSTQVSQPEGFAKGGVTAVTNDQQTFATEEQAKIMLLQPGPTLGELARALNQLKMTPRDIIAIFQALKDAGALHAELIIM